MSDNEFLQNKIGRYGLAPMAGYTDSSFRTICRSFGASFTITEMVSAKALRFGDKKSLLLMHFSEAERPIGIQLFGSDPADFSYAAPMVEEMFHPDFIDINMGCPAPKITGSGAGSKLMDNESLAARIVEETVRSVSVPVTAKIRLGYHSITAPSVAHALEASGASIIFVHGRTRDQMYHPPVDLEGISEIKRSLSIPVYGNGDIQSKEDAKRMFSVTSCDGILVGRGALGNPNIFNDINIDHSETAPPFQSLQDKLDILLEQARASVIEKGEYIGIREMRKHAPYYFKGVNNASAIRNACVSISTYQDLEELCKTVVEAGFAR
ncbi:MAG: tRNA dihydrouridine synthase DusB [Oscillospiraceae bacterium]|nr:tRNA dihydrouridine synthase DusB [Oscillospiraceae bacterium]